MTPTTAAGFVPAYTKAWWKDEFITLVPTNAGIATGEDIEEFYWDGTEWLAGVNGSGTVLPKIASAAYVPGGASTVKDAAGSGITVTGYTLAQLRRMGGLPTTTRWAKDTYITITAGRSRRDREQGSLGRSEVGKRGGSRGSHPGQPLRRVQRLITPCVEERPPVP